MLMYILNSSKKTQNNQQNVYKETDIHYDKMSPSDLTRLLDELFSNKGELWKKR
jgi:hypothetical protein